MADVDYDAPRGGVKPETESLELLQEKLASAADDLADHDFTDVYQLPGSDILDEDLTVPVVPMQTDEFRCSGCFLVLHRSLSAETRRGEHVCRDCG